LAVDAPVRRARIAELLLQLETAPDGHHLWVAEKWPWTPWCEAAISELRPRWAVRGVNVAELRDLPRWSEEAALREINRRADPEAALRARSLPLGSGYTR
jgi:hypothetical protein